MSKLVAAVLLVGSLFEGISLARGPSRRRSVRATRRGRGQRGRGKEKGRQNGGEAATAEDALVAGGMEWGDIPSVPTPVLALTVLAATLAYLGLKMGEQAKAREKEEIIEERKALELEERYWSRQLSAAIRAADMEALPWFEGGTNSSLPPQEERGLVMAVEGAENSLFPLPWEADRERGKVRADGSTGSSGESVGRDGGFVSDMEVKEALEKFLSEPETSFSASQSNVQGSRKDLEANTDDEPMLRNRRREAAPTNRGEERNHNLASSNRRSPMERFGDSASSGHQGSKKYSEPQKSVSSAENGVENNGDTGTKGGTGNKTGSSGQNGSNGSVSEVNNGDHHRNTDVMTLLEKARAAAKRSKELHEFVIETN